MNKKDRGILYGMSLGDGCIAKQATNANYGLTVGHGPKQEAYLRYKAEVLSSIFGGKPVNINSYTSLNKNTQKVYTNLQFRKTHKYFNQIHRNLYPTGTKIFTRKVLDYLTVEGLAYWVMDDGSGTVTHNRDKKPCGCNIRIATYFTLDEAEVTKKWFEDVFSISPKFDVDKRNDKVSLRFNTHDSKTLANIISPYFIPCMQYKLDKVDSYTPRVLDPVKNG